MVVPTLTFLALMLMLIGCDVVAEVNEHNVAMHLLIELLLACYGVLAALLNVVFIVVTIRTWSTVRDSMHVRGELILQTVILLMNYLVLLVIWLCDVVFEDDNDPLSESGEELYDQVFYLGSFINSSVGSLCSIIIGTQYLRFKEWQKNKSLSQNTMEKLTGHIASGTVAIDRRQIAFRAMIATIDGLEAFMEYLAKDNRQNYLIVKLTVNSLFALYNDRPHSTFALSMQLAIELTQYMDHLCLVEDLVLSHENLVRDINHELMHFPQNIPEASSSSLIRGSNAIHRAFHELYRKYIDGRATWRVRFSQETQEQILEYYRRLSSHGLNRRHLSSCSRASHLKESISDHSRRTLYKLLVDATNLIMTEVLQQLESSFNVYRNTTVKHVDLTLIYMLLQIHTAFNSQYP